MRLATVLVVAWAWIWSAPTPAGADAARSAPGAAAARGAAAESGAVSDRVPAPVAELLAWSYVRDEALGPTEGPEDDPSGPPQAGPPPLDPRAGVPGPGSAASSGRYRAAPLPLVRLRARLNL